MIDCQKNHSFQMKMDPALKQAAEDGDVNFLKEAVAVQPSEYFLTQDEDGTIFHKAAWRDKFEFLKEAMNILPADILKQLLQITDKDMYAVLHVAAIERHIRVVKVIKEIYESLSWHGDDHVKPWLALKKFNCTPLSLALVVNDPADETCALEILLMDPEFVSCTIADEDGKTPLYHALKRGFNAVAEKILKSLLHPTSLVYSRNFFPLFLMPTKCSGNVVSLLWEKYISCVDNNGNTLLHSALYSTSTQELALATLSAYPGLCRICNNRGESPLFLAVQSGCEQVVHEIIRNVEQLVYMLRRNDGTSVLHILSTCSEKTGRMLLEKYWWIITMHDDQGKTALDYAKQANVLWLVNLLTKPSLIRKEDFDFIGACKREDYLAVFGFIDSCKHLQWACRLKNDTPLHHLKLPSYKDYVGILKIPSIKELKNMTDHDGATALHRALERKDIYFAKALLLDDEVQKTIVDYNSISAMHLLARLCEENDEWDKMCKLIKVNPNLKTSYIQAGSNLDQLRNTMSIVAALLATITFAAGFTLPGGLNGDIGEALLAKKASFLVFLLADVYAMCTSMLVLFCLIWSIVSEPDMARLLVDRSVFLLMQSLYGTLLAFMTAVYTVVAHSPLWASIFIFVMCSIIGISANRTISHKVIAKLVPDAIREKQDQMQLLEEGNAGAS